MKSVYNNVSEILTDSFSPAIILPQKNYKLYYSSIRHAYEYLQQTAPFCNLKPGDIVTVSLPNSVKFIVTMFTVFSVRATFNPVKVSMESDRFEEHLKQVKPRLVITAENATNSKQVIQVALKLGIPVFLVSLELIEQRFRTPQIIRQFSPIVAHHVKTVTPKLSFKPLTQTDLSIKTNFTVKKFDRKDVALLIQTHGTTGHTKLVPLTHGNVLDSLELSASLFELQASDTSYLIMAMYHTHGLVGVLLSSFFAGSTVLLAIDMSMDNFWKDVLKYRVTWYSAVPLFHKMLLNLPKPNLDQDVSYLRFVQSCGYHLESRLVLELEQFLKVPIITSYTMTEATHLVSTTLAYRTRKLDSVGQPVSVSVGIFDEKGGKLLNGMGEICLSGSTLFKGYFGETNHDAYFFKHDDETWFRTGDLGWFDERGYLVYVGRKLEQIQVDGTLITPSLMDRTLSKHPAIEMGVFYGVPGDKGQHLEAAVVLKPGHTVTEAELKAWLTSWIPTQVPLVIQFVARLPITSMGKLQRHKIRFNRGSKAKL